jgi:hypothetical protein
VSRTIGQQEHWLPTGVQPTGHFEHLLSVQFPLQQSESAPHDAPWDRQVPQVLLERQMSVPQQVPWLQG